MYYSLPTQLATVAIWRRRHAPNSIKVRVIGASVGKQTQTHMLDAVKGD